MRGFGVSTHGPGVLYVNRRSGIIMRGRMIEMQVPESLELHHLLVDGPVRTKSARCRIDPELADTGSATLLEIVCKRRHLQTSVSPGRAFEDSHGFHPNLLRRSLAQQQSVRSS